MKHSIASLFNHPENDDLMFAGCEMYAVFPIVDIPLAIYNELIGAARQHDPPDEGTALRVITKHPFLPFKDYKRASRVGDVKEPYLESKYKGQSISDLRKIFKQGFASREYGWSTTCFMVLDEQTLKDSTVFLASSHETDRLALNYRAEPAIALAILLTFDDNGFFAMHPDHDLDYVFTKEDFDSIGRG